VHSEHLQPANVNVGRCAWPVAASPLLPSPRLGDREQLSLLQLTVLHDTVLFLPALYLHVTTKHPENHLCDAAWYQDPSPALPAPSARAVTATEYRIRRFAAYHTTAIITGSQINKFSVVPTRKLRDSITYSQPEVAPHLQTPTLRPDVPGRRPWLACHCSRRDHPRPQRYITLFSGP